MARTATILNVSLQLCAWLSVAFEPFTPFACARLRKMLDCSPSWDSIGQMGLLEEGHAIGAAELLFTKVEYDQIEAQLAKLAAAKA